MATDLELVSNPNSDIYVLTDIANRSPQLWPKIAEHPNCSPELAQWIHQMLDYQAKTHVDPQPEVQEQPEVKDLEPETQIQPKVENPEPEISQATQAAQPASPYAPRQIQPAPRQYESKKSNTGLKVLVIVLAIIALIAIGFAGWAILSIPASSQPAASPAKTVETKTDTKADTKTKDKVKSDTKKDSNKDTETKKETSKNPDGKNPTFDFNAMLGNDFSSANGRWEAPGGDVLTINDGIFLWEHDGKPFRAIYSPEQESKVPAEYREPNLKNVDILLNSRLKVRIFSVNSPGNLTTLIRMP